jgi:AcrR family transcriptional regulator
VAEFDEPELEKAPAHEPNREDFLQAAWRCFSRNSTASTSMDDVAVEADSTIAALTEFFPDKDELVRAVMLSTLGNFQELVEAIAASPEGKTPVGFLSVLLEQAQLFGIRGDGINRFRLVIQSWSYSQTDPTMAETIVVRYREFASLYAKSAREDWGLNKTEADAMSAFIASALLGLTAQLGLRTGAAAKDAVAALRNLDAGK